MGTQLTIGGMTLMALDSFMEPWTSVSFIVSWLFTALLGTSLAWGLWAKLLKVGEASPVAAWTFLVPVLATLGSVFWLHERTTIWLVPGDGFVLISIYLVNRRTYRVVASSHKLRENPHVR